MHRTSAEINSTVRLDGASLKRIREERRLTQLYISKVVGVTPDTISRWENNRYPSMRRENALKLADALEVDISELLEKPVAAVVTHPTEARSSLVLVITAVLAAAMLAVVVIVALRFGRDATPPLASITAQRILPHYAAPGTQVPVQVRLTQRADTGGFILREYLPKGWKLVQSSPPASSLDNDNGVVRWIIKAGDSRDRIVYLVQVDRFARPGNDGIFQGELVASSGDNQTAVPVQGEGRVPVAVIHWVDQNADGRIDDGEMLQASYLVDEMAGVHIDWPELERLWDAGGYRWNEARDRFVPVKPLEPAAAAH